MKPANRREAELDRRARTMFIYFVASCNYYTSKQNQQVWPKLPRTMRFLSYTALVAAFGVSTGIPLQVTINQRQSECLYDTLEAGYVWIIFNSSGLSFYLTHAIRCKTTTVRL